MMGDMKTMRKNVCAWGRLINNSGPNKERGASLPKSAVSKHAGGREEIISRPVPVMRA